MPAPRLRIPRYRLNKTTGRAVVTIGGRDYWLGKHGTPESRQKYDRLIGEWLAGGRRPPEKEATDLTVVEICDRFWTHAQAFYRKPDGSPSGTAESFIHAIRPLKALYGFTEARKFGPKCLRAVMHKMILDGLTRQGVNKRTADIKHVFKWATAEQLIPADIYQKLAVVAGLRKGKTDAKESPPVRPAPEDHIAAALRFLSPTVAAMVRLQLLTGMRSGELLIMRAADIDTRGSTWVYRPTTHKTQHHGHTREIHLGPQARDILQPLLKPDLHAFIFDPRDGIAWRAAQAKTHRRPKQKPNRRQTKRIVGERYDVAAYRRAIARACQQADEWAKGGRIVANDQVLIPAWHPHQLRHNAATFLRAKYGLEAARIVLGHRTAAVTELYAEADGRKAAEIMATVG